MTNNLITWVNSFNEAAGHMTTTAGTSSYWVGDHKPQAYTYYYDTFPSTIEKKIDDTFNKLWATRSNPIIKDDAKLPRTNVIEEKTGLRFECFIPFATKEEVSVTLDPTTNGIKIEVDSHQDDDEDKIEYHLREISRSSFKRSFAIDKRFDIKKAAANFEDGILEIVIPYAEDAEKLTLKL